MKTVTISKVKRFGMGEVKGITFTIKDEEELGVIDSLLAVAKKLQGFSFEVSSIKGGDT